MISIQSALPQHEISVLAGASGVGKSTLAVQLMATISSGAPFLGVLQFPHERSRKVGYIVADRSITSVRSHADRVGFDIDADTITVSIVDDLDVNLSHLKADALGELEHIITKLVNAAADLVVVDPIMVFLGTDLNRYHLVAPLLIRLNRFAKQVGVTILGIHHTTKARSDFAFLRPQDRISGSSALSAFTSTQWALTGPEELPEMQREQQLSRLDIVSHTAAPVTVWLKRDDRGLFLPSAPATVGDSPVVGKVLSALSDGTALGIEALTTATGASRATVYRALDALLTDKLVTQPKRGQYKISKPADQSA